LCKVVIGEKMLTIELNIFCQNKFRWALKDTGNSSVQGREIRYEA